MLAYKHYEICESPHLNTVKAVLSLYSRYVNLFTDIHICICSTLKIYFILATLKKIQDNKLFFFNNISSDMV